MSVALTVSYARALFLTEDNRELRDAVTTLVEAYERDTGNPAPVPEGIEPGEPGEDGTDGTDGRDGQDGRDGRDGRPPTEQEIMLAVATFCAANNGCAGPTGPAGPAGVDGVDGVGLVGPSGADGMQGPSGVPGPSCPAGFVLRAVEGGALDGWLACAPVDE